MWVYLYPSGTETELKNAYIGEYVEWQYVFDFQNDWLQGCTLGWSSTYFGYEAWQWIYAVSSDVSIWCPITLPSNVYGKKIAQVKLNVYYPSWGRGNAFGVVVNNGYSFRYSREEYEYNYIGFADWKTTPKQDVWTKNWELEIIYNFSTWVISWSVWGTSYSISDSYADTIINSLVDWTFRLLIVTWVNPNRAYLRKATITTNV